MDGTNKSVKSDSNERQEHGLREKQERESEATSADTLADIADKEKMSGSKSSDSETTMPAPDGEGRSVSGNKNDGDPM